MDPPGGLRRAAILKSGDVSVRGDPAAARHDVENDQTAQLLRRRVRFHGHEAEFGHFDTHADGETLSLLSILV